MSGSDGTMDLSARLEAIEEKLRDVLQGQENIRDVLQEGAEDQVRPGCRES